MHSITQVKKINKIKSTLLFINGHTAFLLWI